MLFLLVSQKSFIFIAVQNALWLFAVYIQHCGYLSGSLVRPKVVRSVHYCPATKKVLERKYTDLTSFDAFPSSSVYPTKVCFVIRISVLVFLLLMV